MSTAKFAQLKSIFSHALALREGEVAAYLDQACEGNPKLRAQVEEMLRQAASGDTALITEVPATTEHALQLGTTLAGRFILKRFIGKGGMGEVYLADDLELGGQVALKTVRGGLLDEQGSVRFRREVQLSRQVTHPNICRVFDVGREWIENRELLFLTMEYLEGETLAQRLSGAGKMTPEEAAPLVRQMASALDALHQKGIMHRDLKPGNVMLEPGRLCIMDFGLARAFEGEGSDAQYTQTGAILGTPGYMAPEQLMGEQATAASDIYSMGLLVFEMLTGKKASLSDSFAEGRTGLPPKWEAMILRCAARDPEARPKSGRDAMALLDETSVPGETSARAWTWKWAAALALVAATVAVPLWIGNGGDALTPGAKTSVNDDILQARQLLIRYYKPQNVKDALAILEGVVQREPKLALGHASLASALYRTSVDRSDPAKVERAKQECNIAIELDPEMAEPHVTLSSIFLEAGRRDLARSELKKAAELDANLPQVHFAYAQLYRAENRQAEKEAAIQKAIDLAPDNWSFRNWRGLDYRDQGKYKEALGEMEIASQLMPDNPLAYNNLGLIHMQLRQFAEAEKALKRSIEIESRARTLGNLASVYYLQAKYLDAADTLRRVVELDPKSYVMRANLAAALDRLPGKRADAEATYRKAIELAEPVLAAAPNEVRILGNVASYNAYLGNRDQAMALIRRAIALQPKSPDVANRAMAVHEFLKDRDGALKWAAKAIENGYPLETLKNDPEMAGLTADPRFNKLEGLAKEKRNADH